MKKTPLLFLLAASFFVIVISSCDKNNDSNPVTLTLYDSLGGTAMVQDPANPSMMIESGRLGIRSVVDSAIFVIAADDKINNYFTVLLAEVTAGDLSGFQELSKNLTDFFCVATGAKNFTYSGLSMVDAHDPATNPRISEKVNSEDFDEFITDLGIAAGKNNLPD